MHDIDEQKGNNAEAGLPSTEVNNAQPNKPAKSRTALTVLKVCGILLLIVLVVAILLNSLLSLFKKGYYTTFGKYRLFAVVTDSMEPVIGKGSMIVDRVPASADEIQVGDVISFEVHTTNGVAVYTHRLVRIEEADGTHYYITRGDNAGGEDSFRTVYSDIVGVYTGKKCPVIGSVLGFLQSVQGVITLIVILFIIIVMWSVLSYINYYEKRRALNISALKKGGDILACVNLRYDNINEITAVLDILSMITEENLTRDERQIVEARLREFIGAANIELPQTPETAAILDSLPAPDTPSSLVAALAAGATLRQAEDGQTLVLTTISGEKSMLLTPVQTADGIILCQQGVRLRSDIAPNIEEIGMTSMPGNPEFFEGQPLEKKVIYPELPQPDQKFGAEMLSPHSGASSGDEDVRIAAALAAPMPVGASGNLPEPVPEQSAELVTTQSAELMVAAPKQPALPKKPRTPRPSTLAKKAFAKYREFASQLELRQAEQLRTLLNDTETLTPDEKQLVAEYKAAHPKKKRAPRTPEQRAAAKEAAERRKQAEEAFVNSLSKKDREIYLTEQKLAKARTAAIRKLQRIANDRKLLGKIDDTPTE